MNLRLALALAMLACPLLAQAQAANFSSLEERMTGREFTETGLHKLAPEELAALNHWIRQHSLAGNEVASQVTSPRDGNGNARLPDRPGELPPIDRMAREAFSSKVVGKFSGWTGNTEFELENGMVWVQTDGTSFFIPESEDVTVVIRPGVLGTWRLNVDGYNSFTRVRRIR